MYKDPAMKKFYSNVALMQKDKEKGKTQLYSNFPHILTSVRWPLTFNEGK